MPAVDWVPVPLTVALIPGHPPAPAGYDSVAESGGFGLKVLGAVA